MKAQGKDLDTIKREGNYFFLVEYDEPTIENGWGFLLRTVDARKNKPEQAVEEMREYARLIAEQQLSEYGTVKVRRIGEDAVIAEEQGSASPEAQGVRKKIVGFIKKLLNRRNGLSLAG